MTVAREIMHAGVECAKDSETLAAVARRMRDEHIGVLPVCGADDRLRGMVTDRDIVVRALATGLNPTKVTAGDLAQGKPVYVKADADVAEVLRLMGDNKIRRLPVVEGHRLVGIISEADLATHLGGGQVAEFAGAVYGAPPTN
jgi:CBS domain-containing protein